MTAAVTALGRQFVPSRADFELCSGDRYGDSYNSGGGVQVRQALVLEAGWNQRHQEAIVAAAKLKSSKTTSPSNAGSGDLVLPEA